MRRVVCWTIVLSLLGTLAGVALTELNTGDDVELDKVEDVASPADPPRRRTPAPAQKRILVFGGNGFLGADTVEVLIDSGENVTMVNRGNWYWDSYHRIRPFVDHISCDRENGIDSCEDLVNLVKNTEQFDAVLDFSAYGPKAIKDACVMLKGKTKLYIMISTDSVYDVCKKGHTGPSKESDSTRPDDEDERKALAYHHEYADKKLSAEEELVKQRTEGGDIPYVILRLPDVIGPRDRSYRWWLYQLWVKLESHLEYKPLTITPFLKDCNMSFVLSADVSKLISTLLSRGDKVQDEIFNVAFPDTYTIGDVITSIRKQLGVESDEVGVEPDQGETLFVYPSVRSGPVDVSKVQAALDWEPSPWDKAVQQTVDFFEQAMKSEIFETQRDEIVQILTSHLFEKHTADVYKALEEIYDISLNHFRPRDEL